MSQRDHTPSKRTYPRTATYYQGKFYVDDHGLDCEILNISAGGAKIRLTQEIDRCRSSKLNIPPFGDFSCDIIWQHENDMGIKFHKAPDEMAETVLAMAVYGPKK